MKKPLFHVEPERELYEYSSSSRPMYAVYKDNKIICQALTRKMADAFCFHLQKVYDLGFSDGFTHATKAEQILKGNIQ